MEKEFVSYEIALALKELGFDEPCIGNYRKVQVSDAKTGDYSISTVYLDMMTFTMNFNENNKDTDASALTYSQAFRFFREKKLSDSCVCRYQSRDDGGIYYYYVINHDFGIEETKHFKEGFFSYKEAELACLLKLIELVKNKSV